MFTELDHSQKRSHSMQVLSLSQQLTEVLQELLNHPLVYIKIGQYGFLTTINALPNEHFLNSGSRVALVNHFLRFKIVSHHVDYRGYLFVWNLVSEKVNELYASRFQKRKLVDLG